MLYEMAEMMSSDLKQIEMEDIEESTPDIDNCDAGNSLALLDYVDEIYSFYRENEGAPTHADRIQLMDGPGKGSAIDVSSTKQPQRHQQEHSNSVLSMVCRLLPYAACFLVAVHFARTTYRVLHDPRDLAFVLAAYAMLALLFCCVTKFETLTAAAESRTRGRLKLSVWALSTALTAMFACRVSPVMPPPLNLAVWGMALLVTVGGFCLLFVCDAAGRGYNLESGNEASPSQDDKV